jgi:TrkA domain protein
VADVQETPLPGVGVRYDFTTRGGLPVAVLVHRTGRRELLVYDQQDPDACRVVIQLTPNDTRTLVDLLGASQVSERTFAMQELQGLAIDWLEIPASSRYVGRSLRDAAVRSNTGVSIVAIVRGTATVPAPSPDFTFEPGDIAVVVGRPEGIEQLFGTFRGP